MASKWIGECVTVNPAEGGSPSEAVEAMGVVGDARQLARLAFAALLGILTVEYAGRMGADDIFDYHVVPMLVRLIGSHAES